MFIFWIKVTHMQKVRYGLEFSKRTASLGRESLKTFVVDTLREFGGLSLLSNVLVSCPEANMVEVTMPKECVNLVHSALTMCGRYQDTACCFKECSSP